MSTNIVPFESMDIATLAESDKAFSLNVMAEEFASVKFPVISIKGGRFHTKHDGEKTLITRHKNNAGDPDEPASYIDMVVINLQKAKNFYAGRYVEGSDNKPDCSSVDGITPSVFAQDPQCTTCALCPHNAWGSGVNDKGEATKGKACSDILRLAVAAPSNFDEVYLLSVPPASLRNFAEVSRWLTVRRIPVNRAVVRISFDMDKTGVLTFKAIGGLDDASFKKVGSMMDSELTLNIIGRSAIGAEVAATVAKSQPKVEDKSSKGDEEAKAKAAKAAVKAKKVAAAKAAAEAAAKAAEEAAKAAEDDEDDEDEAPPAKPEKPQRAAKVDSSDLEDELAELLS